jgi:hypothetical protein
MRLILVLLLAAFLAPAAYGQPAPWPPAPTELRLFPVEELRQNTLEPRLGNGTVVNPRDWPASFYADFKVDGKSFSCTATLVGSRSLLTAAHCIADGGRVEIMRASRVYEGRCEQPRPGYPEPISADWALCLMAEDVPAYRYETISLSVNTLRRDTQLLLAGFGCQRIGGTSDGKFRTGPAFIEHVPGKVPGGETGYAHWLATYAAVERGDAFICPGDSGGAVFQVPPGFERVIVAVNSHYDTPGRGVSYLSVLGTSAGEAFLRDWASRHGQRLCGVHNDAPNCRP